MNQATSGDVPWNGPFYASEGFVVDDWMLARGPPPEEPVMMRRPL